jgi:hypothetical protein
MSTHYATRMIVVSRQGEEWMGRRNQSRAHQHAALVVYKPVTPLFGSPRGGVRGRYTV